MDVELAQGNMGVSVNLADIFGRMLMNTHPVVAAEKRQIRCGRTPDSLWNARFVVEGHSARSQVHHGFGPVKEEAAIIEKYYKY